MFDISAGRFSLYAKVSGVIVLLEPTSPEKEKRIDRKHLETTFETCGRHLL